MGNMHYLSLKKKNGVKFQKKEEDKEEEKKCSNASKIKESQATRFSSMITQTKYNSATHELVFSFKLKFLPFKDAHMQGGRMSLGKEETDYEATESAQGSKQKSQFQIPDLPLASITSFQRNGC